MNANLRNFALWVIIVLLLLALFTLFQNPGQHTTSLTFHGSDLYPGSGGPPEPIGPLGLTDQDAASTKISYFPASQASRLCGQRWDWIEAVQGASGQ